MDSGRVGHTDVFISALKKNTNVYLKIKQLNKLVVDNRVVVHKA